MPDTNYPPPLDYITRGEFGALDAHVRDLQADMVLVKANQADTQTDIKSIDKRLDDIAAKLKELIGWRSFLLTGGIGVGWGVAQGILHLLGWGTAP
ncbi:hypothetical protein AmDm5_0489 [Acetobacter malorum]|uniref:Uncharacterized protein n=1 Tax=Acetobacter malorum TaxID=178901 RepID=A0A087PXE5_9PROT|nr:hypothetical protein [Acetobacter malorum]KFL92048.1 hypothetical protein AmDm5_0489 [Acetobacter malorum]OAG78484.1 hypothetical protein Amal_00497 [Acetobacter malorum]